MPVSVSLGAKVGFWGVLGVCPFWLCTVLLVPVCWYCRWSSYMLKQIKELTWIISSLAKKMYLACISLPSWFTVWPRKRLYGHIQQCGAGVEVNIGSCSFLSWCCCQKECLSNCTPKSLLNLLNVIYTYLLQLPLPENCSFSLPCSFCQKCFSSLNMYAMYKKRNPLWEALNRAKRRVWWFSCGRISAASRLTDDTEHVV